MRGRHPGAESSRAARVHGAEAIYAARHTPLCDDPVTHRISSTAADGQGRLVCDVEKAWLKSL